MGSTRQGRLGADQSYRRSVNTKTPGLRLSSRCAAGSSAFPWQAFREDVSVSDARNSALMSAISKTLEGLGLDAAGSDREITLGMYDYWDFDHLTDGQAGWFVTGKIREVLGQRPRITSEEQARREDLSARVMSGELDDVNLYVRQEGALPT